jgi:hypothetical protein
VGGLGITSRGAGRRPLPCLQRLLWVRLACSELVVVLTPGSLPRVGEPEPPSLLGEGRVIMARFLDSPD